MCSLVCLPQWSWSLYQTAACCICTLMIWTIWKVYSWKKSYSCKYIVIKKENKVGNSDFLEGEGMVVIFNCYTHTNIYSLLSPFPCPPRKKNGYLFRLQLYHHHELILLREKVQKSSNNASLSSMTSAQIKEDATRIHREMVALPVLTSTLNG